MKGTLFERITYRLGIAAETVKSVAQATCWVFIAILIHRVTTVVGGFFS